MRPSKREEIVARALAAFQADGYRGAGMDALAARVGASKTSIYNHFPSKDALILAALEVQDRRMAALVAAHAARAAGPRAALLSLFDALADWFASPGFTGCAFQKAAAEFLAPDHPVRAAAVAWKRAFAADLARRAEAAGSPEAAPALAALAEGAIVRAALGLSDDPAGEAKAAAALLLDAAQARGSSRSASASQ